MFALRFVFIATLFLPGRVWADDSFTCPVTKPIESASPAPFSGESGKWFGTDKLWTLIEPGRWVAGRYEHRKIVWFSSEYDMHREPDPSLTITGRRLDGPSEPLIFHTSNAYIPGRGSFIPSNVTLPTLGCWEITGHYKGQDLTFVVDTGNKLR